MSAKTGENLIDLFDEVATRTRNDLLNINPTTATSLSDSGNSSKGLPTPSNSDSKTKEKPKHSVLAFEKEIASKRASLPFLPRSYRLEKASNTTTESPEHSPTHSPHSTMLMAQDPARKAKTMDHYQRKISDLRTRLRTAKDDYKFFASNAEIEQSKKLEPQITEMQDRIMKIERKMQYIRNIDFDPSLYSPLQKKQASLIQKHVRRFLCRKQFFRLGMVLIN